MDEFSLREAGFVLLRLVSLILLGPAIILAMVIALAVEFIVLGHGYRLTGIARTPRYPF